MTDEKLAGHEQRLNDAEAVIQGLHNDISDLKVSMKAIQSNMDQQTEDLKAIREIVTYWNNLKGFSFTVTILWRVAKWATWIVSIAAALVYFGKTGIWRWS